MNATNNNQSNNNNDDDDELHRRNLSLALHHANMIQQRKDLETEILASIEALIEFPSSKDADPAQPSSADVAAFREHVAVFQQSDLDDVVEERNCEPKCGYVFCPRELERGQRRRASGETLRVIYGDNMTENGQSFTVLPNNKVQTWCSSDCGKRAMYIKLQLPKARPSDRSGAKVKKIQVLKERKYDEQTLSDRLTQLNIGENADHDELRKAMASLAIERGDLVKGSTRAAPTALNNVSIREKPAGNESSPTGSSSTAWKASSSAMAIEGYTPKIGKTQSSGAHDDDDQDHNDADLDYLFEDSD